MARYSCFAVLAWLVMAGAGGCFRLLQGEGGGQTRVEDPSALDPSDIALPQGYEIEPVLTGLTFPTDVAFDDEGRMYILEAGYSYLDEVRVPRLLRVEPEGRLVEVARGQNPPWSGVDYHDGFFYVAGGHLEPGQILKISKGGAIEVLVDGIPTSVGDHHTNGPRVRGGWIYFGQGTLTNSAVVGLDNFKFGWVPRHPDAHDVPCRDIVLAGKNYVTANPLTARLDDRTVTGAFVPFGTRTEEGQVIRGQVPCGGAVMRVRPQGGDVELVAWGLRNPWGLAFGPDGELYVTENQYDVRGSRPVFGTGDLLWKIESGAWYGWPDFWAGRALTDTWFDPPKKNGKPGFVLAEHPGVPPEPSARFAVHASATGIAFSSNPEFGHVGQAYVAHFGDMAPTVGKVLGPVGFKVVRVDVDTGVIDDFAVNVGKENGPASFLETGGLERPVNVRFHPDGTALYVVDFGIMTTRKGRVRPRERTGVLWRIQRSGS